MASKFVQSLVSIQEQYDGKVKEFQSSWKRARKQVERVFNEAAEALEGSEVRPENGNTLTLIWREQRLSFRADAHRRRIIRSGSKKPEETFIPDSIDREKIEDEVREFMCAVLEFDPEGEEAEKYFG